VRRHSFRTIESQSFFSACALPRTVVCRRSLNLGNWQRCCSRALYSQSANGHCWPQGTEGEWIGWWKWLASALRLCYEKATQDIWRVCIACAQHFIACKSNHCPSIAVSPLITCSLSPCVCSVPTSHTWRIYSLTRVHRLHSRLQHRSRRTITTPIPSLTMTHHDMPWSNNHTVSYYSTNGHSRSSVFEQTQLSPKPLQRSSHQAPPSILHSDSLFPTSHRSRLTPTLIEQYNNSDLLAETLRCGMSPFWLSWEGLHVLTLLRADQMCGTYS
jgi:hypothetical protein